MDTMSTVLTHLKEKNQDNEFKVTAPGVISLNGKLYPEAEVKLIKTYRFEGESDPGEEAIIYLIETSDGTVGYSIDSYGLYAGHVTDSYALFIHNLIGRSESNNPK